MCRQKPYIFLFVFVSGRCTCSDLWIIYSSTSSCIWKFLSWSSHVGFVPGLISWWLKCFEQWGLLTGSVTPNNFCFLTYDARLVYMRNVLWYCLGEICFLLKKMLLTLNEQKSNFSFHHLIQLLTILFFFKSLLNNIQIIGFCLYLHWTQPVYAPPVLSQLWWKWKCFGRLFMLALKGQCSVLSHICGERMYEQY